MCPGRGPYGKLGTSAVSIVDAKFEHQTGTTYYTIGHFTCAQAQVVHTLIERAGKI